jgi:hypothetical protein
MLLAVALPSGGQLVMARSPLLIPCSICCAQIVALLQGNKVAARWNIMHYANEK